MKKIIIVLFSLGLALGASAQKYRGGGHYYTRPRVSIGIGAYAPLYPYYGLYSPFYSYPPAYGYYPNHYSRLELKIADIKNDYQDKIWSARHDDSLSRKERRKKVHELKHERDQAVIQAKREARR